MEFSKEEWNKFLQKNSKKVVDITIEMSYISPPKNIGYIVSCELSEDAEI